MSLTGQPLFVLTIIIALLGPILVVWWWRRNLRRDWRASLIRWATVALCQLLAVSGLFLWVNNQYGFYTSWSDLAGVGSKIAQIQPNGLVASGAGKAEVLTVPASTATGSARQTLVWLPPQYDQPQFSHTKFPVLMVLPGQPSTPEAMFRHYNFGAIAAAEITARRIPPFVAVFPPLMTHPPRDTECTNISHGPQAETWLVRDVHQAVTNQLRTAPTPWASIGWSTGAFCSAKLLLKHHNLYSAAVGLGGYYQPITDKTTGDLFHRDPTARQQNSPLWLYQHGGLHQRKLLFIYGQQDHEARKATTKMLTATRGDPDVSSLAFPTGGHNYRNYRTYLPDALRWLHSAGALV